MEKLNYVRELLKVKATKLVTEEDKEKYNLCVELLKSDNVFSMLDMETAVSMLYFLGVEEDKLIDLYSDLSAESTLNDLQSTYINVGRK